MCIIDLHGKIIRRSGSHEEVCGNGAGCDASLDEFVRMGGGNM